MVDREAINYLRHPSLSQGLLAVTRLASNAMNVSKKITFFPSVGAGYGLGNISRCSTLARAIQNEYAISFILPDKNKFSSAVPDRAEIICASDLHNNLLKSHCLIFDHQGPLDAENFFSELHEIAPNLPIIALDYFFLDSPHVTTFINLTDHYERPWRNLPGQKYLHGFDYAILREEFLQTPLITENNTLNVLISFGGEDSANWTEVVINWLEKFIKEPTQVTIILGRMFQHTENIYHITSDGTIHDYHVLNDVNNMHYFMNKCDIAFCGGGTTILELAFSGKPVIALPQNNMEQNFINLFSKEGFIIPAGAEAVKMQVQHPAYQLFKDSCLRNQLGEIGRKLVDGKGVCRICKEINIL